MHTPWNGTPGPGDPTPGDPSHPADAPRDVEDTGPWRTTRALDTCCTIRPVDGDLLRWAWSQRDRVP